MDYLILAEVAAVGGYLAWLGGRVYRLLKEHDMERGHGREVPTYATNHKPSPALPAVKIIRLQKSGGYSVLASVSPEHEHVGLALASEGLAIMHPDGRIQHTAQEVS